MRCALVFFYSELCRNLGHGLYTGVPRASEAFRGIPRLPTDTHLFRDLSGLCNQHPADDNLEAPPPETNQEGREEPKRANVSLVVPKTQTVECGATFSG